MSKLTDVLLGVAYGDSLGYLNEFYGYGELVGDNPRGPEPPAEFVVSDDTQMTLHLARGLDAAAASHRVTGRWDFEDHIIDEWTRWYDDPDNNRAPGNNCLQACAGLIHGSPWHEATVASAETCGAVMRVAPVAFLPSGLWQPVAAFQAASTHGGTVAIASSIIATAVIRRALLGKEYQGSVLAAAIELCRDVAPRHFVDMVLDHPFAEGDIDLMARYLDLGLVKLSHVLESAAALLPDFRRDPWHADPSEHLSGWLAADALACALLCVDMLPDDPVEALRRAAVTGGDSDSIAAIAGAVLGALHGNPWPSDWHDRLELRYRDWIAEAEHYIFDK